MYCVMSILHGGNGLPLLALPVYNYIVTGSYTAITVPVSQIPDMTLQFVIRKVCACVRACVRACMRACMRACLCACVHACCVCVVSPVHLMAVIIVLIDKQCRR